MTDKLGFSYYNNHEKETNKQLKFSILESAIIYN